MEPFSAWGGRMVTVTGEAMTFESYDIRGPLIDRRTIAAVKDR